MPIFKLVIFVAGMCIVTSKASACPVDWRFPTDQISSEQWATFRNEIRSKPEVRRSEAPQQDVFFVLAEDAYYIFTQQDHPAYPAVVIRCLGQKDGELFTSRKGHFAGSKSAFTVWWHQFDELDEALKLEAKRMKGQLPNTSLKREHQE